jgi:sterol desaturase/sphingolipid hydroxylase (fatty acid hydroxylase superfamily)
MWMLCGIVGWIFGSTLAGELLGYLLHRLLHSGWIPWLSFSHMHHHLVLYGPKQNQRPGRTYQNATGGQIAVGNIGSEWLVPSLLLLAVISVFFWIFHVRLLHQAVFFVTVLAWSFIMFSYLHDRMHIHDFWMDRNALLKHWFRRVRRLHDIHHRTLNDGGLMDTNFGIAFFLFDRLFGTLCVKQTPFNHIGYGQAMSKFSRIFSLMPPGHDDSAH